MSVWNGHYKCTCYHPLFVFNQFGDLERCALREVVLKPAAECYQDKISRIYFRANAAFAMPAVLEFLRRSGSNTRSGFRPTGSTGQDLLPAQAPRRAAFERGEPNFTYQAASWTKHAG
jgi:hypothetical protein